jgi:hypothetical protein
VVIRTCSEEVTIEDIGEHASLHINEVADKDVLWDLSEVNLSEFTVDAVMEFVSKYRYKAEIRSGRKTALVGMRDMEFAVLRMLETISGGERWAIHFKVFRSTEEAMEWLLKP